MEKKKILHMQLNHFGVILSNLSIVGIVFIASIFLYFLFYGIFFIIMLLPVFLTLGTVLFSYPNYFAFLSGGDVVINFLNSLDPHMPLIYGVTIGCAVLSIVFLSLKEGKKSWARIVISSIIALSSILLIAGIIGG